MNDLNILKEVGLKEVSRNTHIGADYLEYIVNKDFEKLVRVNVSGYIKILQREYGIDLSGWQEEFDAYCKEFHSHSSPRTTVDPKIKSYTDMSQKTSNNIASWLLWVVLLAGFGAASYYFDAHKYIDQIPSLFEDKNRSVTYSDSTTVKELSKNISKQANSLIYSQNNETNVSVQISIPGLVETNTSVTTEQTEPQEEIKESVEENATISNIAPNADEVEIGELVAKGSSATLIPKTNVWIGIIDLKTKSKKSQTSTKEIELDMSGEYLIVCGNGNITIKINGETKSFDGGRAARFIIKNSEIRMLTYDEFVGLNGGKSW